LFWIDLRQPVEKDRILKQQKAAVTEEVQWLRLFSGTTSKSKRYLCWQDRRLPQRIFIYASLPPPCRRDIIFDLEAV
jgi:hypothetical protein